MLSTQAFNGLLKTLEEPPPHVKFIFATTEIRKVPVTVLSRCQRFDLRRIDAGALIDASARIAGLEGIAVDAAALAHDRARRRGLGARCAVDSRPGDRPWRRRGRRADAVRTMLGLADRGRSHRPVREADARRRRGGARPNFALSTTPGADPAAVLTDLADFNHLVTRLQVSCPPAADDPSLTEDERARGASSPRRCRSGCCRATWQMLLKGIAEVQAATRPLGAAEMVLIRLAHAADLPTLDEALRSLTEEGSAASAVVPQGRSPVLPPPCPPVRHCLRRH